MKPFTLVLLAISILLLATCDNAPSGPASDPLDRTPMADSTAEVMALWLSNELVAPLPLYRSIHRDLALIETQWGDSIEIWDDSTEWEWGPHYNIGFTPMWYVSWLTLVVDSGTYRTIREGDHVQLNAVLDSLNGALTDDPYPIWPDSASWFLFVNFDGRLNSKRAAEHFIGLPGIRYVGTTPLGGAYPLILPLFNGRDHRYAYVFAWGDCPSGCIAVDYVYFEIRRDTAVLLDHFRPQPPFDYFPPWVDSVRSAYYDWQLDHFTWSIGS